MNKVRREQLGRVCGRLRDSIEDLTLIRKDEEEAMDNVPENLQDTEITEKMEEAISNIDDAIECIEEAIQYLDEVM